MFEKKTWEDRITENPGRRKLINVESGEQTTVDVSRYEGNVSRTGTSFSASNMNDLEKKAADKEEFISKIYDDIEKEKEQKFVNLLIEIMVSITLKQVYEESD